MVRILPLSQFEWDIVSELITRAHDNPPGWVGPADIEAITHINQKMVKLEEELRDALPD